MKKTYVIKTLGGLLFVVMVLGLGYSMGRDGKSDDMFVEVLNNNPVSTPSESTRELLPGFRYHEKLISPAMLNVFRNWTSDNGPANRRQINLTNCFKSGNEFGQTVDVLDNGGYKVLIDGKGDYYYRFIGNLGRNLYVVYFVDRVIGGSGAFSDMLILRASREYALVDSQWQQQTMLTCLGSIPLGDRVAWKFKLNPRERSVTMDTDSLGSGNVGHFVVRIPSKVLE